MGEAGNPGDGRVAVGRRGDRTKGGSLSLNTPMSVPTTKRVRRSESNGGNGGNGRNGGNGGNGFNGDDGADGGDGGDGDDEGAGGDGMMRSAPGATVNVLTPMEGELDDALLEEQRRVDDFEGMLQAALGHGADTTHGSRSVGGMGGVGGVGSGGSGGGRASSSSSSGAVDMAVDDLRPLRAIPSLSSPPSKALFGGHHRHQGGHHGARHTGRGDGMVYNDELPPASTGALSALSALDVNISVVHAENEALEVFLRRNL